MSSWTEPVIGALHILAVCVCCFGLMLLWYKCYIEQKAPGNKYVIIFSVLAIVMFTASSIIIALYYIRITDAVELYIAIDIWQFFQAFGHAFTYSLFITRLKNTFKGTKYQYSCYTYSLLSTLVILFVLIQFCHIMTNYTFYSKTQILAIGVTPVEYYDELLLVIWGSTAIDLVLGIIFLWLLFNKLWILTVDMQFLGLRDNDKLKWANSASNDRKDSIALSDVSFDDNQSVVINGISKITVLSVFSVSSAQILLIWLGIISILQNLSTFNYWMMYLPFRAITNCFCIVLSFEFMSDWYLKVCILCNNCVAVCCRRVSKRKLKSSIKNELRLALLADTDNPNL